MEGEELLKRAYECRRRGEYAQCAALLEKGVSLSHSRCELELAWMLHYGGLDLKVDINRALCLYELGANRGYGPSCAWHAIELMRKNDLRWVDFAKSAWQSGDPYGMAMVLELRLYKPPDQDDYPNTRERVISLYEAAHAAGDAISTRRLACLADEVANISRAFDYHLQAALQGLPSSQERVAEMYLHGSGCEANRERALHFFEETARQGRTACMLKVAQMRLAAGSLAQAARWLIRGATREDSSCASLIASRLTEATVLSPSRLQELFVYGEYGWGQKKGSVYNVAIRIYRATSTRCLGVASLFMGLCRRRKSSYPAKIGRDAAGIVARMILEYRSNPAVWNVDDKSSVGMMSD